MQKKNFISSMFGSSTEERMEKARDLYEKAANSFKLGDQFQLAGEMYEKCAHIERETDGMPSSFISEALNCYKKTNTEKYIEMSDEAVLEFLKEGRISQAARLKKDMGE